MNSVTVQSLYLNKLIQINKASYTALSLHSAFGTKMNFFCFTFLNKIYALTSLKLGWT